MEKVYIILTHTGTVLSKIIKRYTKDEYSHISIALDRDLNYMYSFGRLHPYNAFIGGFVHEQIDKGTFKRFKNTKAAVYSMLVTDEQYRDIVDTIRKVEINRNRYHFNVLGLFAVGFHKKIKKNYSFYCAEFVRYVLNEAKVEVELPELIKPEDFKYLDNINCIYKGYLRKYNKETPISILSLAELLRRKSYVG